MILVLADDITGAAEIAGTALRYGMTTSLITGAAGKTFPDTEVVVYATDGCILRKRNRKWRL